MPSVPELLIILLIVLLIFGAGKLPAIGDALGRSIKNFKKASNVDDEPKQVEDKKAGELAAGSKAKELSAGEKDEGEWEEVVVRRKKNKAEG